MKMQVRNHSTDYYELPDDGSMWYFPEINRAEKIGEIELMGDLIAIISVDYYDGTLPAVHRLPLEAFRRKGQ